MDAAITKQLDLLREITRCGSPKELNTDISEVRNLMNTYLPDILTLSPDMYIKLDCEYRRLKEYAAYPQLAKKNIITLCGKSLSGKSSFFNSLYNGVIMPADISSASVPVYAVCGSSSNIYALNKFDHFISMKSSDMKTIFSGMETENPNISLPLSHIFSSILTFASAPVLRHIAFLDTPGYNIPAENDYLSETNETNLIQRINESNYILWFADINIKNTGITENDINMLKKLDQTIPKLIIVSKADAFTQKDLPEIIEKTKKLLNARGIGYIDVLAYSAKHPEKFDKYKILAYLDRWDKSPAIINFSQIYESIFDLGPENSKITEFKNLLIPEIQKTSNGIYNIEKAFTQNEPKQEDTFIPVEASVQKPKNPLKNIDISKIKLTDLPIPNPEKLFRNYNDRNTIDISAYERYINAVSIMLTENMKDITPSFSAASKNAAYKAKVSSMIAGVFNVNMSSDSPEPVKEEIQPEKSKSEERQSRRSSRSRRRSAAAEQPVVEQPAEAQQTEQPVSRRERPSSGLSRRRPS